MAKFDFGSIKKKPFTPKPITKKAWVEKPIKKEVWVEKPIVKKSAALKPPKLPKIDLSGVKKGFSKEDEHLKEY